MTENLGKKILYFFLAGISLQSICGALIYRLYTLNWMGVLGSIILTGGGLYLFSRLFEKKAALNPLDIENSFIAKKSLFDWQTLIFPAIYFILFIVSAVFLFQARTGAALTSPWQAVPAGFFIAYIVATGYLFWLILNDKRFTPWLIVAHYFLSFSVLWIVFKIGYGYDPFIHQATMDLIDKQGAVSPKPFYYLGQYSLTIITHKLFFIPIVWLDKLLIPVLAAITIPLTIGAFLKKTISNSSPVINNLSLIILLILPFSIFTLTVPQNLAYLFLVLAIFFALSASERPEKVLSYLLALSAVVAHPIAGIPALLFVAALSIYRVPAKEFCFSRKSGIGSGEICLIKPRQDILIIKSHPPKELDKTLKKMLADGLDFIFKKNFFYTLIAISNALMLPILFWLTQKGDSVDATGASFSRPTFSLPAILVPQRENIFLNFIYFFQGNLWLFIIIASGLAVYAAHRYRRQMPALFFPVGFSVSLIVAYFLTRLINFNSLISYERADYANRILIVAFIFLVPIIAIIACKLINLIVSGKNWLKYSWLIFLILLIAVSLYGSYPRRDNYFNSHGFSVGQNDLDAVNYIEQNANGEPYAVLANQQVSVGALWTFGFSRYLKDNLYFYPIPTGGPLYQIYLDMVYKKADRNTALKATDLAGVNNVYFVINKYWTGFDKIVEQAKIGANSYESLNNGEIYIFTYLK